MNKRNGALDIDSKPPATTVFEWPKAIDWEPKTIDFNPDEQTLLIVVQGVSTPRPADIDACLAGACPKPAPSTLPRMTSSTYFGLRLIDSRAPLIAKPPNWVAEKFEIFPKKEPIAVLLAATM